MAIDTYGKNGINITKVTAIADWPSNGMLVSSPSIVLVKTNNIALASGQTLWLQVSLDTAAEIDAGTAEWVNYQEIVPGNDYYIELAYSPYAINFNFSTAVSSGEPTVWVRR